MASQEFVCQQHSKVFLSRGAQDQVHTWCAREQYEQKWRLQFYLVSSGSVKGVKYIPQTSIV